MNRQALRAAARKRLDDIAQPYGWPDDELNRWLDEAVREASLRAGLTVATTAIPCRAGVASYSLPYRVRYVLDAWWTRQVSPATPRAPLERVDRDAFEAWARPITNLADPTRYLIAGRTIRLHPTPKDAGYLEMRGRLVPPPMESDDDEPDISPYLHEHLVEWVMYQAGLKRDVDYNLPDPLAHEAIFARYFGPRPSELTLQGWLEYGATDTVRPDGWRYGR